MIEKPKMYPVTVYLPEDWINSLDLLVKNGFYKSRAEAIRFAIKDLLLNKGFVPSTLRRNRKRIEHIIKSHTK